MASVGQQYRQSSLTTPCRDVRSDCRRGLSLVFLQSRSTAVCLPGPRLADGVVTGFSSAARDGRRRFPPDGALKTERSVETSKPNSNPQVPQLPRPSSAMALTSQTAPFDGLTGGTTGFVLTEKAPRSD